MAAYTFLLLVIALCAPAAHSLTCYTCTSQSQNAQCLTETNCTSGSDKYCETTFLTSVPSSVGFVFINKTCTSSCTSANFNLLSVSYSTSCCSTDLCNVSGGASVRSSCAAILLALGSVLIILKSAAQ
ncbi:Snake toxin and toxin-like protein [Pristimantis euphronides]